MNLVNDTTKRHLGSFHPEALTALQGLEQPLLATGLDPQLLAWCRTWIRAALRQQDLPEPGNPLERACADFCQQFMLSVSDVTDQQVADLARHLNPDHVYNLVHGVYLIEMSERLDLCCQRLLS